MVKFSSTCPKNVKFIGGRFFFRVIHIVEHFLGLFAIPQACTSHCEEGELLKWDAQRWHKEDNHPQKDRQYTEVWKGNRLCEERKVGGLKLCPVLPQV